MSNRAMYLRTLFSLEDISYDPSKTIVFALPLDAVKGEITGLTAPAKASHTTETANSKKEAENDPPTKDTHYPFKVKIYCTVTSPVGL